MGYEAAAELTSLLRDHPPSIGNQREKRPSGSFVTAKVLGKFQALPLIVGHRGGSIKFVGFVRQFFEDEAPDWLAVFEQERHIAAANL